MTTLFRSSAHAVRAALVCALALAVAACGSASSVAGAGEQDAATRTWVDAAGERVQIPVRPKRVLALSEVTLDGSLALGVTPVATTAGRGQAGVPGYLAERAKDVPLVGTLGDPDLERVVELRPDLILIDGTAFQGGAIVERLRQIAPTVQVSNTAEDWRVAFEALADVLGRSDEGASLLAEFDERVEQIRAGLGDNADAEVSVMRWGGLGLPSTMQQELATSRVLKALGLRRPAFQAKEGAGHSTPVSLEDIRLLDGDWIFFGSLGGGGAVGGVPVDATGPEESEQVLTYTEDLPGFDKLGAVKSGRVVPVDGSAWMSAGGLLAAGVVLDDVERVLVKGEHPAA